MKIDLNLESDSYNTNCEDKKLEIEFFYDGDFRQSFVWIKLDDREVSVNKEEFIKILSII